MRAEVAAAIARRGDFQCAFRVRNPHTGVRGMRALGRVKLDETGAPLRLVGLAFDTTDRELSEGEVARAHRDQDSMAPKAPLPESIRIDPRRQSAGMFRAVITGTE